MLYLFLLFLNVRAFYQWSFVNWNSIAFIRFNINCSVIINHKYILEHIDLLPLDLLSYLMDVKTDLSNLEEVRNNIYKYFRIKNREESFHQILDGLKTNGVVKSVPYALAKINKRFSIK